MNEHQLEERQHDHTPEVEVATDAAIRYGAEHPRLPWLLTDFDVWIGNPYYSGPPVPHPDFPS